MAVLHNHNRSTLLTCFLLSQSQSIDFFNHQASHYDRLIPSTIKPLNTTAHNQQHRIHLDLRLKYLRSTCTPSTPSIRPPVRSPSVSALILEIHVTGPPSIGLHFMAGFDFWSIFKSMIKTSIILLNVCDMRKCVFCREEHSGGTDEIWCVCRGGWWPNTYESRWTNGCWELQNRKHQTKQKGLEKYLRQATWNTAPSAH